MKMKQLILVLCLITAGYFAFGQGITNSKHDFSGAGWNTSGEICKVCHTPHGAVNLPSAPLWNHALTTATYTLYSSPTLTTNTLGQPSASSQLCLSCHDNTVAVGGGVFISTLGVPQGYANLGTDLSNDHPISFIYDDVLASNDLGLKIPSTTPSGIGTGTIKSSMLYNDKMECASCHDVHNSYGFPNLLIKNNDASALCLTCHAK